MALTNATTLADYGAGIGTQGAALTVDATNKRVGVGTDAPAGPEGSLQVGTGITFFGNTGIVSAIGGRFSGDFNVAGALTFEDVTNIDSLGFGTFRSGLTVQGAGSTTTTLSVSGVSTFASNVSIADSIFHTGDTDTALRFPAADTFTVETAGSERVRVDSSGNTGINCTSGGGKLAILANASTYEGLELQTPNGDGSGEFHIGVHQNGSTAGRTIVFKRGGADGMDSESLRIAADGKIGINTNDPKTAVHIHQSGVTNAPARSAALYLENNANCELQMVGNASNDCQVRFGIGGNSFKGAIEYQLDNDALLAYVNGSERLRITSAGNVDINGTPPWTVTGGNYRNLSISGEGASASGFLWLGNGAAATNADFDLGRVNFVNGTNIVAQIKGTTQTSANDDGRISFFTKATGSNIAEALRIDNSGTVLVGATAQQYGGSKLEVADSDNAIVYVYNTDVSASGTATLAFGPSNSVTGSQIKCIASEDFSTSANRTAGLAFETRQDGTLAERLRINSDGKLILSGTARTTPFIVGDGGMCIEQSYDGLLKALSLRNKDTDAAAATALSFSLNRSGGDQDFEAGEIKLVKEQAWTTGSSTNDGAMVFSTILNGTLTEKLRITSDGKVHIDNTTSSAHTNRLLSVGSTTRSATYYECRTSTSGDGGFLFSDGTGGTSEGYRGTMEYSHSVDKLFFKTSGTNQFSIESDGGIFFHNLLGNASSGSAVKYSNSDDELRYDTSSRLLKTNITECTYGIETIKKLKPSRYTPQEYDTDGNINVTDEVLIGFIADEMVEEVPEVVQMYPKSTLTRNDEDTEIVPAAISYDKLTAVLTKALQEAIAKIETLEAAVAALQG